MDENGKEKMLWQSSWGFSTRLIGAVVMVHGDDKGLVLPPKLAPNKAVIVPIVSGESKERVLKKANELLIALNSGRNDSSGHAFILGGGLDVFVDSRDNYSAGWKFNEWELKGIPLRIEVGPKDIEKKQAVVVRRDNGKKEFVPEAALKNRVLEILEEMQKDMLSKAKKFLDSNIVEVDNYADFRKAIEQKKIASCLFFPDAYS